VFLKYLAGQGIDHHSRQISKFLPQILELEMTNFVSYMESRNKQTDQIVEYTRRELRDDHETPGIMTADFWTLPSYVETTLFTDSLKGADIKLQFMDVADIHEFSEVGQQFFQIMQDTNCLELFDQELVRKMIMFKWPVVREHIIKFIFIPFLIQLIATVFYTSYLFHD